MLLCCMLTNASASMEPPVTCIIHSFNSRVPIPSTKEAPFFAALAAACLNTYIHHKIPNPVSATHKTHNTSHNIYDQAHAFIPWLQLFQLLLFLLLQSSPFSPDPLLRSLLQHLLPYIHTYIHTIYPLVHMHTQHRDRRYPSIYLQTHIPLCVGCPFR